MFEVGDKVRVVRIRAYDRMTQENLAQFMGRVLEVKALESPAEYFFCAAGTKDDGSLDGNYFRPDELEKVEESNE